MLARGFFFADGGRMAVWQVKLPDGMAHDYVTRFLEGKWVVSRNGAVIAWFVNESDARSFEGE